MNDKRCGTCRYSETQQVIDPFISTIGSRLCSEHQEMIGPNIYDITKCHIKGKPEKVDPKLDWCHQWMEK